MDLTNLELVKDMTNLELVELTILNWLKIQPITNWSK